MKVMKATMSMYLSLFYVQLALLCLPFLYFLNIFNLGDLIQYLISGKVIYLTINVFLL